MPVDRHAVDRIHQRVLDGDVTASADLFRLVHRALAAAVRKRVSNSISWDDAGDAATDAIVEYLGCPQKFDQSKASLFGYLFLIARGDALNTARSQAKARKIGQRAVELAAGEGNTVQEPSSTRLDADRIMREHHSTLVRDIGDEEVLRLYLQGEKETAVYAQALGLSGDVRRLEAQVKRRKDRIEQRLKRLKGVLK